MLENSQSSVSSIFVKVDKKRLFQGDVLRDINIASGGGGLNDEISILKFYLPYSIIMTQDCDLLQDINWRNGNKPNKDKYLQTVLVCPAYQADSFFSGNHIDGWVMRTCNIGDLEKIKKNDENNRYHYLNGNADLQVPELVIDFKHFYTIPRDFLYAQYDKLYLSTINELFRERLSQRFANYLSRFGLPDLPGPENTSE